jgi:hypothetical protein
MTKDSRIATPDEGMMVVSEEEFYAFMGQRNVHPRSEPNFSAWETPSRELLGISRPGYKCEGNEVYMLMRKP